MPPSCLQIYGAMSQPCHRYYKLNINKNLNYLMNSFKKCVFSLVQSQTHIHKNNINNNPLDSPLSSSKETMRYIILKHHHFPCLLSTLSFSQIFPGKTRKTHKSEFIYKTCMYKQLNLTHKDLNC